MIHTKYHKFTDSELMSIFEERDRSSSALLQELANRLFSRPSIEKAVAAPTLMQCPCCEAELKLACNEIDMSLELELNK